jgi:hypothetical protein
MAIGIILFLLTIEYVMLFMRIAIVDEPDYNICAVYGQNFSKTLSALALLNHYIYDKNYTRHLFLYSGLTDYEELRIKIQIKDIDIDRENRELQNIVVPHKEFEGLVKKKSLKSIMKTDKKFKTLEDAVCVAQNDFSKNLLFGNDVARGVKERNKKAGPPDKVYYYLKTLNEIAKIKRNIHPDFSLVLLARMYGCLCSGESKGMHESKKRMKQRIWHDGTGYSHFIDHLKPSEGERLYGDTWDNFCIRIYFKWDEKNQKTIVGWIGDHP